MKINYKGRDIVFVHIGGNAGTSIEWYLYTLIKPQPADISKRKEGAFEYLDTIRDEDFRKHLTGHHELMSWYINHFGRPDLSFAVVRNPYDRMLAKYFTSPQSKNATNHAQCFEEFIVEVYEGSTEFAKAQQRHIRCQSYYTRGVDEVLLFEDLPFSFKQFCLRNKLPVQDMIRCNSTSHPMKGKELYTQKGKDLVHSHNKTIFKQYYDN